MISSPGVVVAGLKHYRLIVVVFTPRNGVSMSYTDKRLYWLVKGKNLKFISIQE
jgi:hypothetical protein